jgi:hypothetical protein
MKQKDFKQAAAQFKAILSNFIIILLQIYDPPSVYQVTVMLE